MSEFLQRYSKLWLLACLCCWQFTSQAQQLATSYNLGQDENNHQNSTNKKFLSVVLSELESKYGVRFSFDPQVVNEQLVEVTGQPSDKSLERELHDLLYPLNLNFKEVDKNFYVIEEGRKSVDKVSAKKLNLEDSNEVKAKKHTRSAIKVKNILPSINEKVEKTITGTVTDIENNEPLPGVNVLVKGTTLGTVTSVDGNYQLTVPDNAVALVFSSVGYTSQEVTIGNQTVINVQLIPDIQALSEVVVTAFGIEKEKKALTYSAQEVASEAISRVNNPNVISSLQGKVAGVTVRLPSGQPGNTPNITLRGSRSISGSNEPLYVVDGQIVNGNPSDLNPSDIESINVLKGPNASALYGILAANGAIVITTKNGAGLSEGQPVINFETSYQIDQITRLPNTQTMYAQGENGQFNPYSAFSWGPRIDTLGTYTNQLGELEEAAVYDNTKDFFRNGGLYNVHLDVGNNFDGGNYNIGGSYVNQQGIVPNTDFNRFNFNFGGNFDLSPKLSVGTSVNASFSETNGVPPGGNSSLFYASFFTPPTYNLSGKPISVPGNPYEQINFRSAHDNIYWSVKNNSAVDKTSRTFGNFHINYQPLDWLSVNYRFGNDYSIRTYKQVLSLGSGATGGRTNPPGGGRITDQMIKSNVINSNLGVRLSRKIGDFDMNFLAGGDFYDSNSKQMRTEGNNILIGGFDNISNTSAQNVDENIFRRRIVGLYGSLDISWQNSVFLSLTGRNDRVSNLPSANRDFFYPSIGLGVVFTEFLNIPEKFLTFGKLRASYAESGQAGDIYVQNEVFVNTGISQGRSAGAFIFPFNGINAFTQSSLLIADDLKPENTRMNEIGFDVRFLNNRIGLDYTYFSSETRNQIFNVPVPVSTGFTVERRNSGRVRAQGHEIIFTSQPIKSDIFNWNFTVNFTSYDNKVVSLAEGIERLSVGSVGAASVFLEEGKPYAIIRGTAYARDPETNKIVVDSRRTLSNGDPNPLYGMPLEAAEEQDLGTQLSDFEIGFINQFNYNGLSLAVQIDWREGGSIYSSFNRLGSLYGMTAETQNREPGQEVILDAKKGYFDSDANLIIEGDNDIPIIKGETYYRGAPNTINEPHVYDASYVRLREVRLSYDLPSNLFSNNFIHAASIYLVGRNLALKTNVPNHDPEEFSGGGGAGQHLTYPQIKSFGGGVKLRF